MSEKYTEQEIHRYELTRDAVVNAIEEELLEEFLRTFWTMK